MLRGLETPPRTWGRLTNIDSVKPKSRNTPTDVGKTLEAMKTLAPEEKHPHGRGEDLHNKGKRIVLVETPPRTWGRQSRTLDIRATARNTPTDVGKTHQTLSALQQLWKHPHGRGEDISRSPEYEVS